MHITWVSAAMLTNQWLTLALFHFIDLIQSLNEIDLLGTTTEANYGCTGGHSPRESGFAAKNDQCCESNQCAAPGDNRDPRPESDLMQQPAHHALTVVACQPGGALGACVARIPCGLGPGQAHRLMRAVPLTAARGCPLAVTVVVALRVSRGEVCALMTLPGAAPRHALEIVVAVILHQLLPVEAHRRARTRRRTAAECRFYAIVITLTFLEGRAAFKLSSILFLVEV